MDDIKIEDLQKEIDALKKERDVMKEDNKQLQDDIEELRKSKAKEDKKEPTFRDLAKALLEGVE